MSKENVQNNNEVKTEVTTAGTLPEETQAKKPGLVTRAINATKRTIVKVRRSRAGRVVITVLELGGVGFAGYKLGFKNGVKSVAVPAEVYIDGGTIENIEETPVEEPAEEEVTEHE